MTAVDTNVLLYVHDSRDPRRQAIAAALVSDLTDGVLISQDRSRCIRFLLRSGNTCSFCGAKGAYKRDRK